MSNMQISEGRYLAIVRTLENQADIRLDAQDRCQYL